MKVAVWDTYVRRKPAPGAATGLVMHFDVLVPEGTPFETVQEYGRTYLTEKNEAGQALTTKECKFCHIETPTPEIETAIASRGYSIIEMEGCDA